MILTANVYNGVTFERYALDVLMPALKKYGIEAVEIADEELQAEINHGRWIVKCPCGGAEKMWEERLFMCQSCWNSFAKHRLVKVAFPEERKVIEEILLKRPIANRNWHSGETVEQLQQENDQHKEELL